MESSDISPPERHSGRIVYLFTTFPKLSETFVQREVRSLLRGGLNMELRTIWGGDQVFEGQTVHRFSMWELLGVPFAFIYWAILKPKTIFRFLLLLITRPTSWLNFQEIWLGAAYGLLKARRLKASRPLKMHTAWATMPTTAALLVHRLSDIPFSMGAHAYDIYLGGGDGLLNEKVEAALWVQSSNASARRELAQRFPESIDKLFCIRRCLDEIPEYAPRIPENIQSLRLISVGRLIAKKGFLNLLELIAVAREHGLHWTLDLVGGGPERSALESRIESLNIGSLVTLHGALAYTEVRKLYQRCDIFAFAGLIAPDGDRDGLPNVIPEAMAHGLPVFASENAGVLEAIEDQRTGWVVDFEKPEKALQSIRRVVVRPEIEAVLANAHAWVVREFDPKVTSERLLKLHNRTRYITS